MRARRLFLLERLTAEERAALVIYVDAATGGRCRKCGGLRRTIGRQVVDGCPGALMVTIDHGPDCVAVSPAAQRAYRLWCEADR